MTTSPVRAEARVSDPTEPDSLEEFFAGVDLDAMPRWTTADDLASLSIAAFAKGYGITVDEAARP